VLEEWCSIPGGGDYGISSLRRRVGTGSGAHLASYPVGTVGSCRCVGLAAHLCLVPGLEMHGAVPPLPIRIHGVVLGWARG